MIKVGLRRVSAGAWMKMRFGHCIRQMSEVLDGIGRSANDVSQLAATTVRDTPGW